MLDYNYIEYNYVGQYNYVERSSMKMMQKLILQQLALERPT